MGIWKLAFGKIIVDILLGIQEQVNITSKLKWNLSKLDTLSNIWGFEVINYYSYFFEISSTKEGTQKEYG